MKSAKNYILVGLVSAVGAFFFAWSTKPCPDAVFDEEALRRAQQENKQLRDQYTFDSTYTKQLEDSLTKLGEAHNKIPVQERAANAIKTTHNAHADSLLKWHLRPIGTLGTP